MKRWITDPSGSICSGSRLVEPRDNDKLRSQIRASSRRHKPLSSEASERGPLRGSSNLSGVLEARVVTSEGLVALAMLSLSHNVQQRDHEYVGRYVSVVGNNPQAQHPGVSG
jgi:hypothetical protein